jgi:hypothetical protein
MTIRCAASNRSPLTTATPQVLLDRLLSTSIMKTNRISTRYKLHHTTGIVTESISENTGYVHVRLHNDSFRIFVPSDKKSRKICYRRQFPEALAKLFQIGSNRVETEYSESDSIPPSPIYTPPQSPESARRRARDSTPQGIPRGEVYNTLNAYRELLSHVIRVADRTELPRCNALAHPSSGQNFPGFNRADAFGIRSQNQINHDVKVGAAGELFVSPLSLILLMRR